MKIRHLVAQGLCNAQIARVLGVHRSTITRQLRAQGLTNPPKRQPELLDRRERVQRLRIAGLTAAEIARAEGISRQLVYGDLRLLTKTNTGPRQTENQA
jgi:DNA-binding CsgD family transcriptional regulator